MAGCCCTASVAPASTRSGTCGTTRSRSAAAGHRAALERGATRAAEPPPGAARPGAAALPRAVVGRHPRPRAAARVRARGGRRGRAARRPRRRRQVDVGLAGRRGRAPGPPATTSPSATARPPTGCASRCGWTPAPSRPGRPGRTTHGRRELAWDSQVPSLRPDLVVVLRRGDGPRVRDVAPEVAQRALVAGTFAAGELRRFWTLTAVLGLATGVGPVLPAVEETAQRLLHPAALRGARARRPPRPVAARDARPPARPGPRSRSDTMTGQRIEVAQVVTRFIAGAGRRRAARRAAAGPGPLPGHLRDRGDRAAGRAGRAGRARGRPRAEPGPDHLAADRPRVPRTAGGAVRAAAVRRGAHPQREGGRAGPAGPRTGSARR